MCVSCVFAHARLVRVFCAHSFGHIPSVHSVLDPHGFILPRPDPPSFRRLVGCARYEQESYRALGRSFMLVRQLLPCMLISRGQYADDLRLDGLFFTEIAFRKYEPSV